MNKKNLDEVLKALVTAEATTGEDGSDLIPERLDPILVEEANKISPLREFIEQIPWSTNAYECNVRTSLPDSDFYNESDAFAGSASEYERRVFPIRAMRTEGAVSNLMIDASQDYINALSSEILGANQSLAQKTESALLNADGSGDSFTGIRSQIRDNGGNIIDAEGAAISFNLLDEAIKQTIDNNGNPNLILVSSREAMKLNQLMRGDTYHVYDQYETEYGVKLRMYSQIPILWTPAMPVNLATDAATPGTGDQSEVLVLDTSEIKSPVLRDHTYEEIPQTTDSVAFWIKKYFGVAVKSAMVQAIIENVGKPS